MDNLILGLLLFKGRTIYEIKERIAQGMNMMYSASIGSIQAAIKKLLGAGFIVCEEAVENGKFKKVYIITDAGRAAFNEWINSPFDDSLGKNPEMLKIYFMGVSNREGREQRIERHIESLRAVHLQDSMIVEEASQFVSVNELSPEMRDIANYQMMSAKFGADIIQFQIEWFSELLNKINEGLL